MTVKGEHFITEMLRAIRTDLGELRRDITDLTLRQNATEHFEQGLKGLMASMHGTLDALSADMRQVKKRLVLIGGEA